MANRVKINYINRSMNKDLPKVFIFMKNMIPTFDALVNGVAWRVIEDVGRGSSCSFNYTTETKVSASWNNNTCHTAMLDSSIGESYCVVKDETGITMVEDGVSAGNSKSIDVANKIHVPNGISVNLFKDDKLMMTKNIVAYDQKATFVLHPKLYWGLASEIQEGEQISSAVINSNSFFELDLEGVTEVTVALCGNAEEGYRFVVEKQF